MLNWRHFLYQLVLSYNVTTWIFLFPYFIFFYKNHHSFIMSINNRKFLFVYCILLHHSTIRAAFFCPNLEVLHGILHEATQYSNFQWARRNEETSGGLTRDFNFRSIILGFFSFSFIFFIFCSFSDYFIFLALFFFIFVNVHISSCSDL